MSDPPGTRWLKEARQDNPSPAPQQPSTGSLLSGWLKGGMDSLGDWISHQQAISQQQGLWVGGQVWEGGHPTTQGIADSIRQWALNLGTGDVGGGGRPGVNYDLLEALDLVKRAEQGGYGGNPWSEETGGEVLRKGYSPHVPERMFQAAGGPTEDYARFLMDLQGKQDLWDMANFKRRTLQSVRQTMSKMNEERNYSAFNSWQKAGQIAEREHNAASHIAQRFGVDVDAPRPGTKPSSPDMPPHVAAHEPHWEHPDFKKWTDELKAWQKTVGDEWNRKWREIATTRRMAPVPGRGKLRNPSPDK